MMEFPSVAPWTPSPVAHPPAYPVGSKRKAEDAFSNLNHFAASYYSNGQFSQPSYGSLMSSMMFGDSRVIPPPPPTTSSVIAAPSQSKPLPASDVSSGSNKKRVDPRSRHAFYKKTDSPDSPRNSPSPVPFSDTRLHLVLDLDNTLIHATSDPRARSMVANADDLKSFSLVPPSYVKSSPFQVHVKQRPGLEAFLVQASEMFQLHIYTMGTREYADGISKILDPKGKLFSGKIVSREDANQVGHEIESSNSVGGGVKSAVPMPAQTKSLSMLFPEGDDSSVLILDDREDVWNTPSGPCRNLVKIEPYVFFPGLKGMNEQTAVGTNNTLLPSDSSSTGAVNGVGAPMSAEVQMAMNRSSHASYDDQLSSALSILRAVHKLYFARKSGSASPDSSGPVDVKDILSIVRQRVLSGVRLVFFGFSSSNPDQKPQDLWNKAVAFGARCFNATEVDANGYVGEHDRITHVIVSRGGNGKVEQDLLTNTDDIKVVHWRWLTDSVKGWKRCDEKQYEVVDDSKN